MIVVDKFNTLTEVAVHLDMAKKCYAIIKQRYLASVVLVAKEGTDGLIEEDIEYEVRLLLYDPPVQRD